MTNSFREAVKTAIVRSPLYDLYVPYRRRTRTGSLDAWNRSGRPVPPPHAVKQAVLREYARRFQTRVPIETGTYLGDMVAAMLGEFEEIQSIELDSHLARQARRQFARHPQVRILEGDSASVLPGVLAALDRPALFWLDGHFSASFTARGESDTPVSAELLAVLNHPVRGHVLIIDDAHEFGVSPGYPTLAEVEATIARLRPDLRFAEDANLIRIHQ